MEGEIIFSRTRHALNGLKYRGILERKFARLSALLLAGAAALQASRSFNAWQALATALLGPAENSD